MPYEHVNSYRIILSRENNNHVKKKKNILTYFSIFTLPSIFSL